MTELQINAKRLPRYQAIASASIILVLFICLAAFMVFRVEQDNQRQLAQLEQQLDQNLSHALQKDLDQLSSKLLYSLHEANQLLNYRVKNSVELAHTIATTIYQRHRHDHDEATLKQLIIETLRPLRFFNGRGYIFIDDFDGYTHLQPTKPEMEGLSMIDVEDSKGTKVLQELIQIANSKSGEGFFSYHWYNPLNPNAMQEKLVYTKAFKPFNWLIASGDYPAFIQRELRHNAIERLNQLPHSDHQDFALINRVEQRVYSRLYPEGIELTKLNDEEMTLYQALIDAADNKQTSIRSHWGKQRQTQRLVRLKTIDELDWVLAVTQDNGEVQPLIYAQKRIMAQRYRDDLIWLGFVLLIAGLISVSMLLVFNRWFKNVFNSYQNNIEIQQHNLEENAKELALAAQVFEHSTEGIMITNASNKIVTVNPAFSNITGYSREQAIGLSPAQLLKSGRQDKAFYQRMWQSLDQQGQWQGELFNRRKNGEVYPQWLNIKVHHGKTQRDKHFIANIQDLSEYKAVKDQLYQAANYDSLTNLANRYLFTEQVKQAIKSCEQQQATGLVFMLINLDRFKQINETLSHQTADQVLKIIALRLQNLVPSGAFLSRFSGDEFAIVFHTNSALSAAGSMANSIIKAVSQPIDDLNLVVTPSIGISVYPDDGCSLEELLANGEAALEHAKNLGRNNYQFYTDDMNTQLAEKLSLELDLRRALKNDELELFYQPQYCLRSGELMGCEALIRWRDPEQGLVPPFKFIPLAEETGLISDIGLWVLNQACRQIADWNTKGLPRIEVAINVSTKQISHELIHHVRTAIKHNAIDAKYLCLEITESALMDDIEENQLILAQLRQLGVKLALDDFGTGYSSLAYLKRLPMDKLKIDREFVKELPKDKDDIALCRSIIDVANNLGMQTVAEGIETQAQFNFLGQLSCNIGQGFLMAKPLELAEMQSLLERGEAWPIKPAG